VDFLAVVFLAVDFLRRPFAEAFLVVEPFGRPRLAVDFFRLPLDAVFGGRPRRFPVALTTVPGLLPLFGVLAPCVSSERWVEQKSFARLFPPTLKVTDSVAGFPQTSQTSITDSAIHFPSR